MRSNTTKFQKTLIASVCLAALTAHAGQYLEKNGSLKDIGPIHNTDPGIFKLQQAVPNMKVEGVAAIQIQKLDWNQNQTLVQALSDFAKANKVDVIYDGSRQTFIIQPEGLLAKDQAVQTSSQVSPESTAVQPDTRSGPGFFSKVGDGVSSAFHSVGHFFSSTLHVEAQQDSAPNAVKPTAIKPTSEQSAAVTQTDAQYLQSQAQNRFAKADVVVTSQVVPNGQAPSVITTVTQAPGTVQKPTQYLGVAPGATLDNVLSATQDPDAYAKAEKARIEAENARAAKDLQAQELLKEQAQRQILMDQAQSVRQQQAQETAARIAQNSTPQYQIAFNSDAPKALPVNQTRQTIQASGTNSVTPTSMSQSHSLEQSPSGPWIVQAGQINHLVASIADRYHLTPVYSGTDAVYLDRAITLNGVNAQRDAEDLLAACGVSGLASAQKGQYLVVGTVEQVSKFNPAFPNQNVQMTVAPAQSSGLLNSVGSAMKSVGSTVSDWVKGNQTQPEQATPVIQKAPDTQAALKQEALKGDWTLSMEPGDSLKDKLTELLDKNGWTLSWLLDIDKISPVKQTFKGNTVTEMLRDVLPRIGLDANVYPLAKRVEIRELSK